MLLLPDELQHAPCSSAFQQGHGNAGQMRKEKMGQAGSWERWEEGIVGGAHLGGQGVQ